MKGRAFWALVGSVLLHLGLIGWMRWDGSVGRLMDRPLALGAEALVPIQVRLLPVDRPSGPAAAVAPLPRAPTVAQVHPVSGAMPRPAQANRVRMAAQPVAEDGRPAGSVPLVDIPAEDGAPEAPVRHKPLVLELPAKGFSHAPDATAPQTKPAPDRLRDALQPEGRVAIQ